MSEHESIRAGIAEVRQMVASLASRAWSVDLSAHVPRTAEVLAAFDAALAPLLAARAETRTVTTAEEFGVRHPDYETVVPAIDKAEARRMVEAAPTLLIVRREVTDWIEVRDA